MQRAPNRLLEQGEGNQLIPNADQEVHAKIVITLLVFTHTLNLHTQELFVNQANQYNYNYKTTAIHRNTKTNP